MTPLLREIVISKENTVEEVIEIIIEDFMNNSETDKSLMKNGTNKNIYELRYLDEEDNYKPILGLSALDKKRNFSAF